MEPQNKTNGAAADIEALCAMHAHRQGPLLPILHAVQLALGYISTDAIERIATYLNVTRAEVYGVVSFYSDFRQHPPHPHLLKVCRAEACQAQGGRELWASAEQMAAQANGEVEVEAVYCLGNCPCGPSAQFDERTLGRVTTEQVRGLIFESGPRLS